MAGDRRISLVLPAYNEEANVTEAIRRARSVAHRLCSAYEIVVVDDGSTDGTAACVEAMTEGHSDLVLLRHPRQHLIARGAGGLLHRPGGESAPVRGDIDTPNLAAEAHRGGRLFHPGSHFS